MPGTVKIKTKMLDWESTPQGFALAVNNIKKWHPFAWPSMYLKAAELWGVTCGDEPIAYVWFTSVSGRAAEPIVELHLCASPEWGSRWLTLPVFSTLYLRMVSGIEAEWVLAMHSDTKFRGILKRLGFTPIGRTTNILNTREAQNGEAFKNIWRRQARSAGSS